MTTALPPTLAPNIDATVSLPTATPATAPASTTAASASLTANFDTFLTLLTTQLRNQDPLDPLDTDRFTEQLVQFSGVEQSIGTNSRLDALIALQSGADRSSALSLVGRPVSLEGDAAALTPNGADWTYTLPANANTVSITVLNDAGEPIATVDGDTAAGENAFRWNGLTDDGDAAAPGLYRLSVTASDAAGAPLPVGLTGVLTVDAASFIDGAVQLETIAGLSDLSALRRVGAE